VIEKRLHTELVEDLNPAAPVTITGDLPISKAVALMKDRRIGCLIVAGESGNPLGILTEADLIQGLGEDLDLSKSTVADIMTHDPESLRFDHPLGYVLQRMRVTDCRHLPVVDAEGKAIGVVSSRDVLNFLDDSLQGLDD